MIGTQRPAPPVLPRLIAWPEPAPLSEPMPMGRVERCACGGFIASIRADDWNYIAVQVRRHQASPQHEAWRARDAVD